jgi:hypothetical protein
LYLTLRQLIEAETTAAKRQEGNHTLISADYHELMKNLAIPKDGILQEVTSARQSEAKWKAECHHLVSKLEDEV